jgi:hypothetical protein
MYRTLKIITPNTTPVLDLEDVKRYCKLTLTEDDGIIKDFIASAKVTAERMMNRQLLSTSLQLITDDFKYISREQLNVSVDPYLYKNSVTGLKYIQLMRPPVIAVQSVKLTDSTNTQTTVSAANYFVDQEGRLIFNSEFSFNNMRDAAGIEVNYTAGFGTNASDIPADIKIAMKGHIFQMYSSISTRNDQNNNANALKIPESTLATYNYNKFINGL